LTRFADAGMLVGRVGRLRQTLEQLRLTEPLTPAERRVLELLPTQLTAAQIAARLFVSTNTAKTHLRHLYAKLEVTTRTDAVERAAALGLLTPADEG
jgi:LuxR family maltose regulon positive regulatory protein